jgi:hypothetical protein
MKKQPKGRKRNPGGRKRQPHGPIRLLFTSQLVYSIVKIWIRSWVGRGGNTCRLGKRRWSQGGGGGRPGLIPTVRDSPLCTRAHTRIHTRAHRGLSLRVDLGHS